MLREGRARGRDDEHGLASAGRRQRQGQGMQPNPILERQRVMMGLRMPIAWTPATSLTPLGATLAQFARGGGGIRSVQVQTRPAQGRALSSGTSRWPAGLIEKPARALAEASAPRVE